MKNKKETFDHNQWEALSKEKPAEKKSFLRKLFNCLFMVYILPVAGTYVFRLLQFGEKGEERALLGFWENDFQLIVHILYLNIPIYKKGWIQQ